MLSIYREVRFFSRIWFLREDKFLFSRFVLEVCINALASMRQEYSVACKTFAPFGTNVVPRV